MVETIIGLGRTLIAVVKAVIGLVRLRRAAGRRCVDGARHAGRWRCIDGARHAASWRLAGLGTIVVAVLLRPVVRVGRAASLGRAARHSRVHAIVVLVALLRRAARQRLEACLGRSVTSADRKTRPYANAGEVNPDARLSTTAVLEDLE